MFLFRHAEAAKKPRALARLAWSDRGGIGRQPERAVFLMRHRWGMKAKPLVGNPAGDFVDFHGVDVRHATRSAFKDKLDV